MCWDTRGCDDEMMNRCPHYTLGGKCPVDCAFTECHRPTHAFAADLDMMLDPNVDRMRCEKEVCRTCEFFIKNGPRVQLGNA